ncbi:hypothetical protein ACFLTJ_04060 [Chloroflexota bacterium]
MKKRLLWLPGLLLVGVLLTGCGEIPTYIEETIPIEVRVNQTFAIGVSVDPIGGLFLGTGI